MNLIVRLELELDSSTLVSAPRRLPHVCWCIQDVSKIHWSKPLSVYSVAVSTTHFSTWRKESQNYRATILPCFQVEMDFTGIWEACLSSSWIFILRGFVLSSHPEGVGFDLGTNSFSEYVCFKHNSIVPVKNDRIIYALTHNLIFLPPSLPLSLSLSLSSFLVSF